jgi:hypothetical protein
MKQSLAIIAWVANRLIYSIQLFTGETSAKLAKTRFTGTPTALSRRCVL